MIEGVMPELPEVECVKNSLARLKGREFTRVTTLTSRLRERVQEDLEQHLVGRTVVDVQRRGKYLVFVLDRGYLVAHLGMTGKLLIDPAPAKHDHVRLGFRTAASWSTTMPENSGSSYTSRICRKTNTSPRLGWSL
ncbi:hypothetical protein DV532_28300 (plasmid) [Pseudomonas sp. Leaf58]|uniref:DNA-formamidopyrimidine glycosylase family protein n=1 Tax=Pseudomonas sp. Leaf58 TaxID=1736226 RepID=UPI000EA94ADC|nr:hypothetical protein DV532_28300 [Pseudomonas sp. Leaf58]